MIIQVCCADCALKFLATLKSAPAADLTEVNLDQIKWAFYNPNIQPRSEYLSRLKALKQIALEQKMALIIPSWSPKEYFQALTGLANPFSAAKRCPLCWRLRLERVCQLAVTSGEKVFSTTLLTSHYQSRAMITKIAQELAQQYGLKFYLPDQIVTDLPTSGFYKQNYCGCAYSLVTRLSQKFLTAPKS